MAKRTPILSYEGPSGLRHEFYSTDEITDWLTKEVDSWSWTARALPNLRVTNRIFQLWNELRNTWNHTNNLDSLKKNLEDKVQEHSLFGLNDPEGKFIVSLLPQYGEITAAWTAQLLLKQPKIIPVNFNENHFASEGLFLANLYKSPLTKDALTATSGKVSKLFNKLDEELTQRQQRTDRLSQDVEDILSKIKGATSTQEKDFEEFEKLSNEKVELLLNSSEQKIEQVINAHRERMVLSEPAQLWKERKRGQDKHKDGYLKTALRVGILGSLLLIAIYLYIALKLPLEPNTYTIGFIVAGLLLLSTGFLWFLRIVIKLYLSSHHLAESADEKSTMISTYLSLIADGGAVNEADRAIILGSIFKLSSDGIVKDEGTPDVSLSALLSKLVNKP